MYASTIPQFTKMLRNLSGMLDKAAKYADQKKFDVGNLLTARLAPDQFHFIKQVQVTCDTAKGTAARLAGKEPPKFEDNETTLDQLRERIRKTIAYLETVKAEDWRAYETQKVKLPWKEGKYLPGGEYLTEMGIPNFYFHLTTAYAILRHNGVDLGKMDYLGDLRFRDL